MICSWYTRVPYVSFSTGSSEGCAYLISWRPCFLSTKSLTMPEPNGPGRKRATKAPKSSKTEGLRSFTSCFIPADSNWNTPSVFPVISILYVSSSSRGMLFISMSIPWRFFIMSRVWTMIVKFFSPKKSIFNRPIFSQSSFWNSVITFPSFALWTGTTSSSGWWAMITPAACIPVLHLIPSMFLDSSMILRICASSS